MPAVVIATAGDLVPAGSSVPVGLLRVIVSTTLNAGTMVPGFVAYSAASRHPRSAVGAPGCIPNILGVLVSAAVSGVPLVFGILAYVAYALRSRGSPEIALAAIFALPLTALVGGVLGLPAHYVGLLAASAAAPESGRKSRYLSISSLVVVAAGCLFGTNYRSFYVVSSRHRLSFLVISAFLFVLFIGILWACVGSLARVGGAAGPGWRRAVLLAGAALLAAFGVLAMYAFSGGGGSLTAL